MASDDMRVRLRLREIRVLAVLADTPGELRVAVESTVRRPRCAACGFKCHRVHDRRRREIRDLEVSGRRTTLVWRRRRFVCGNCECRWVEDHCEFDGRLTRRLARRVVADAGVMPVSAAARRDIQRRRPHGATPAFDPEVFRARFLLTRRGDTLTDTDHPRLDALCDAHPRLKARWQALQELHGLYLAEDRDGALEALGRFCDLHETGELPESGDIVDTIISRSDEILALHHSGRANNGRIEGANNLLQVLRRTAHGFTDPANLEARSLPVT